PPHAATPGGSITAEINDQLLQIEQRLNQEIATLRAASEHLNRVRRLRVELERLLAQARAVNQQNQQAAGQQGVGQPHVTQPGEVQPGPPPQLAPGSSIFTTGHQYGANPGADVINSGDPRLPEGLTLPPGWTLLPLERVDNGPNGMDHTVQPTSTTTMTSPAAPAVASPETSQAPTLSVPVQDQTSGNVGENARSTANAETLPVDEAPQALALQPTPTVPSAEHRAESPSQEWTDVAPRGSFEARPASSIPTTWGSNGESANSASSQTDTHSPSASNGKGQTASVEETPDEEA
ncbi:hypothetical protein VN97_g10944, partial [Penicillium thymicola]